MEGFEALKIGSCNMLQSRLSSLYDCECLHALVSVMREGFEGRGRSPWPLPPIYTQSHTFCGGNGCIPVSAAASKTLKDS